jgi:hypothetical protein
MNRPARFTVGCVAPDPFTDEEIRAVTVGELPVHNATIHLAE